MSTAGKVLVVLVMLASIALPILAAGVTQLNRNGNKALIDLADRVTMLEDDLKTTQDEIVKVKGETTLVQEQMVRDLAGTGSRQTNMERVKSNIRENLSQVQYQLATRQETVKNAEQTAQQRAAEKVAEQKTLDVAKAEVETLKVQNSELMNRLTSLRNELKTTLKASLDMLDMLGRAVKVPSKHKEEALLFAALRDPDGLVWKEAVQALWTDRRINTTFVYNLTSHLEHPNAGVRRMAALALRDVAPWVIPETLPRLADLLLDRDAEVREAAIYSLEGFGTAAAEAALPVLEGPPPDPKDSEWLRQTAMAVCRIDPRHPDPAAWLLLRPMDRADAEAVSQAVVGLAFESGYDIGPGLAWVLANGSDTVWPRVLPIINHWGGSGLYICPSPFTPEVWRLAPFTPMPAEVPKQSADVETLVDALFARIRDPQTGPELRTMALNALVLVSEVSTVGRQVTANEGEEGQKDASRADRREHGEVEEQ
ncbi:MAG: HEAT repeat domain-containing protein [Planctomycetaceae bacterium]|nr:HEAT repeat domain-containing protein [Planctomycetaceae bacterium]